MSNKSWKTDLWELSNIFRAAFGLLPDDEARSGQIQKRWIIWGPPVFAIAMLLMYELVHLSWLLLAVLGLIFFYNGLRGWRLGRKWLAATGGYAALIIFLENASLGPDAAAMPELLTIALPLLLLALLLPAFWCYALSGEIPNFFCGSPVYTPSCLFAWLVLALAWALGMAAGRWRRRRSGG